MKKSKKKRAIKSPILRGYLFFTGAVAALTIFAGAFFTAGDASEFVTLGSESVTVKSLVSGYTQAQGIFADPLRNKDGNIIPEKAAQGFSYFLPAPLYSVYDLSVSVYEFGKDVMEAVYEAREINYGRQ